MGGGGFHTSRWPERGGLEGVRTLPRTTLTTATWRGSTDSTRISATATMPRFDRLISYCIVRRGDIDAFYPVFFFFSFFLLHVTEPIPVV